MFVRCETPRLSAVLSKGCKRLKGSAVKRKAPLSRDDIHHAIKTLGSSSHYDDCLFLALLVTGFNGLLRLAELSMPDAKRARNWRKITRRTTVEWLPEGYAFFLPAHKADTAFEGNKVIIPSDDDPGFNPLPIFRRYLTLCDTRHIVHPALWITSSGSVPTRSWFMKRLRQVFPSTSITGQSMRAGGATDLAVTRRPTLLDPRSREMVLKSLQNIHSKKSCPTPSYDQYESAVALTNPPHTLPSSFQFLGTQ